MFLALKSFRSQCLNQNLLISTDNSSVVAYLNKQEGTHSQDILENHGLVECHGDSDSGKTYPRESECCSRFKLNGY